MAVEYSGLLLVVQAGTSSLNLPAFIPPKFGHMLVGADWSRLKSLHLALEMTSLHVRGHWAEAEAECSDGEHSRFVSSLVVHDFLDG